MTISDDQRNGGTRKVLIICHSGSGSTKTISELFRKKLSELYAVDMVQVGPNPNYQILSDYDFLLFGFPTYHGRPSTSMMEYVDNMPRLRAPQMTFVFTTCGLYTGNSMRILITRLWEKNVIAAGHLQVRGPASDGVLLYPPQISLMVKYEKKAGEKVTRAVSDISRLLNLQTTEPSKPTPKWYVPLNGVVNFFGERAYHRYRDGLHILGDECTNCNLCVKNYERGCWLAGQDRPSFKPMNCEFCLECVHNCPQQAIVFSEKMRDKPRSNRRFYRGLKAGLLESLR